MLLNRFDYDQLVAVQYSKTNKIEWKYARSSLNYAIQIYDIVPGNVSNATKLILDWVHKEHPKEEKRWFCTRWLDHQHDTTSVVKSWADLESYWEQQKRKLLQQLLLSDKTCLDHGQMAELCHYVQKEQPNRVTKTIKSKSQSVKQVLSNEALFIHIFTHIDNYGKFLRLARICRTFYKYSSTVSFLNQAKFPLELKVENKQYFELINFNRKPDWYFIKAIQKLQIYSTRKEYNITFPDDNLQYYKGYRYHIDNADSRITIPKITFYVPSDKDTVPKEWVKLNKDSKTNKTLKVFTIENDTKSIMHKPLVADIICWKNCKLSICTFHTLVSETQSDRLIVLNSEIVSSVRQMEHYVNGYGNFLPNKKLYIIDDNNKQNWNIVSLVLTELNLYSKSIIEMVIKTSWFAAKSPEFTEVMTDLVEKTNKFNNEPVSVQLFLVNNKKDNYHNIDQENRWLHKDLNLFVNEYYIEISNNTMISQFEIALKDFTNNVINSQSTNEYKFDCKDIQSVETLNKHCSQVTRLVTGNSIENANTTDTVMQSWQNVVDHIYNAC